MPVVAVAGLAREALALRLAVLGRHRRRGADEARASYNVTTRRRRRLAGPSSGTTAGGLHSAAATTSSSCSSASSERNSRKQRACVGGVSPKLRGAVDAEARRGGG
jgi:hypothetical protein